MHALARITYAHRELVRYRMASNDPASHCNSRKNPFLTSRVASNAVTIIKQSKTASDVLGVHCASAVRLNDSAGRFRATLLLRTTCMRI